MTSTGNLTRKLEANLELCWKRGVLKMALRMFKNVNRFQRTTVSLRHSRVDQCAPVLISFLAQFERIQNNTVFQHKRLCSSNSSSYDSVSATSLAITDESKLMRINWSDGSVDNYPAVYLRDNCQCPGCFLASSKSRVFLIRNLDLDIKIKEAKLNSTNDNIEISWSDGHKSTFTLSYLKQRSVSPAKLRERKLLTKRSEVTTWDASHGDEIRRHTSKEILESDAVLLSWLLDLERFGITIIEGMDRDPNSIRVLSKRIGFLKLTHYGIDFVVKSKVEANNAAYTSKTLGLHVDLPYYEFMPGTQFLHCIDQHKGEGGENEFVDGFNIEKLIRKNYPDEHKILTQTKVDFVDVGTEDIAGEFDKMFQAPIFQLDEDDEVSTVRYSNEVRDSYMTGPVDHVLNYYKSLKLFDRLAHDPKNMIVYKLKEGECVVVDNHRVLHARRGFTMVPGEQRWLMGGYVDWDEVRSRINVLKKKFQKNK